LEISGNASFGKIEAGSDAEKWFRWATQFIESLDPLKNKKLPAMIAKLNREDTED